MWSHGRMPSLKVNKSPRYHRKTIKDRSKRTSEAGKSLSSFARGRILRENVRPEMITENGRLPAETGGLESRGVGGGGERKAELSVITRLCHIHVTLPLPKIPNQFESSFCSDPCLKAYYYLNV